MFRYGPSVPWHAADVCCDATTGKLGPYIDHFHMQDGALPHIHESVKALLLQHFTEERVISRFCPNSWLPRSPDPTSCDFGLWAYLKTQVYFGGVAMLNDLKNSITLHVRSLSDDLVLNTLSIALKFCRGMRVVTWSTFLYIVQDTIDNCSSCAILSYLFMFSYLNCFFSPLLNVVV
ncbi:uncharacterized protein TNCV_3698821 [Trichonephila clavipes]|uniref:Uncharacterized protein n=1 Tax=Trichonephila clavipes TaxID=2585209 RepID=A0A8X6VKX7_TRICX|nr:uncharacterized protein TNCV_3698821 [Trichonephila clavipes]